MTQLTYFCSPSFLVHHSFTVPLRSLDYVVGEGWAKVEACKHAEAWPTGKVRAIYVSRVINNRVLTFMKSIAMFRGLNEL